MQAKSGPKLKVTPKVTQLPSWAPIGQRFWTKSSALFIKDWKKSPKNTSMLWDHWTVRPFEKRLWLMRGTRPFLLLSTSFFSLFFLIHYMHSDTGLNNKTHWWGMFVSETPTTPLVTLRRSREKACCAFWTLCDPEGDRGGRTRVSAGGLIYKLWWHLRSRMDNGLPLRRRTARFNWCPFACMSFRKQRPRQGFWWTRSDNQTQPVPCVTCLRVKSVLPTHLLIDV